MNLAVSRLTLRTATQNSIPILYFQLHYCDFFFSFLAEDFFFPSNIYLVVFLEVVSSERSLWYLGLTCLSLPVLELILVMSGGLCCIDNSAHLCYFPCKDCNLSAHETSLAPQTGASPSLIRHQGTAQVREWWNCEVEFTLLLLKSMFCIFSDLVPVQMHFSKLEMKACWTSFHPEVRALGLRQHRFLTPYRLVWVKTELHWR